MYHVLYRHIYKSDSEDLIISAYDNIIMDSYINVKLMYERFDIEIVREILWNFNLDYIEINTGINQYIESVNSINNSIVRATQSDLNYELISFQPINNSSYNALIDFLSTCEENDKLFISIQSQCYNRAYDEFSYPIYRFIEEFTNIEEPVDIKSQSGSNNEDSDEQDDGDGEDNADSNYSKDSNGEKESQGTELKDSLNNLDKMPKELSDMIGEIYKSIDIIDSSSREVKNRKPEEYLLFRLPEWKSKLKSFVENSIGIVTKYNPDGQNRRYEGQLGRLELYPAIEKIVLAFDISGSMSTKDYQIIINYVEDLIRELCNGELNIDTEFKLGYIYWSGVFNGDEYVLSMEGLADTKMFDKIFSHEQKASSIVGGGTDFASFIRPFVTGKYKREVPDILIVFTDGQFLSYGYMMEEKELSRIKSWYKQNKDRVLFILTTEDNIDDLKKYDSSYKSRTIVFQS